MRQRLSGGLAPRVVLHHAGFTLLELITALAITSMMVVMLVMALNQASRAWTVAESRVDTFQAGRAILDLMARDLAQTCPNAPTNFNADIIGTLVTNAFTTTIGTNGAVSDLCDVSYEFDPTKLSLRRRACYWDGSLCSSNDLADPGTVLNCLFVYYTTAVGVASTNFYDSTLNGGRPPAAVEISLDLLDAKSAGIYTNLPTAATNNFANTYARHFSTMVYIPGGVQ
jgi:type II secretory pathway pseudopilin PulG